MPVVSAPLAKECMTQFEQVMQGNDLTPIHNAFANSVSFQTTEFSTWIAPYLASTDKIRISFGIYTQNASQRLGVPEREGRLTAFVWPLSGTQEFEPFNVGELLP